MPDSISDSKPILKDDSVAVASIQPAQGLSDIDEARLAKLEKELAQLRKVLRDYYDVDGKGQVG